MRKFSPQLLFNHCANQSLFIVQWTMFTTNYLMKTSHVWLINEVTGRTNLFELTGQKRDRRTVLVLESSSLIWSLCIWTCGKNFRSDGKTPPSFPIVFHFNHRKQRVRKKWDCLNQNTRNGVNNWHLEQNKEWKYGCCKISRYNRKIYELYAMILRKMIVFQFKTG